LCPALPPPPRPRAGPPPCGAGGGGGAPAAPAGGPLGRGGAPRLRHIDLRGRAGHFGRSVAAGLITTGMAITAVKLAQQQQQLVRGVPLVLVIPGALVATLGCVALVRAVWSTLCLGFVIGIAQAVPLGLFIHNIWSQSGR